MRGRQTWPFWMAMAPLICGCGSAIGDARQSATLLAAYTTEVQAETDRFAESRATLAQARQANLNALERSATDATNRNHYELFLWSLGTSKHQRELFDRVVEETTRGLGRQDELRALEQRHAESIDQARTRFDARSEQLARTAQALSQLGSDSELGDDLRFYASFFKSVRRSIEEAREAAAAEARAGSTATAEKAAEE